MSATDPLDAALRRLHLPAVRQQYPELAAQAVAENWSYPEYLERLAQAELVRRQERRLAQATRRAGFPFLKTLEEFDFTFQASLPRKALGPYLGPELVSGGRSLILWGPPGLGKTALAIALAYKAIQYGASARFVTCTELIGELVQARAKGEWEKALAGYLEPAVLVIDEVGYLSYGPYAANVLFPVVDKRYLKGDRPMLLTTNKDPREWGAVLHDPDLSAAILDRLLHRGEILQLTGRSYRQHRPGQAPPAPPATPAGNVTKPRVTRETNRGNVTRKSDVSGGPLMPREREYKNAAERQAAYRARHRAEEPPLQSYLAGLARTLHGELRDAVAAGRSPLPAALVVRRADDTLRNLIRYLRAAREAAAAAALEAPAAAGKKGGKRC